MKHKHGGRRQTSDNWRKKDTEPTMDEVEKLERLRWLYMNTQNCCKFNLNEKIHFQTLTNWEGVKQILQYLTYSKQFQGKVGDYKFNVLFVYIDTSCTSITSDKTQNSNCVIKLHGSSIS